jgi:CSLREA domain-containing protein
VGASLRVGLESLRSAWLGGLLLGWVLAGAPAQAATFTVNATDDAGDSNIGNGTCRATGGPVRCTLRAAIEEANFTAAHDTINFNIAGTITLGSLLPLLTQQVTIDAATGNPSWVNSPPYAPVVAVNGNGLTAILDLQPGSSGSTIRGLCLYNGTGFPGGINITGSSNNVIAGNFIGTNLAGTAAGPGNQVGIFIGTFAGATQDNNRIGVDPAAVDPRDRNVISANTLDGIEIRGEGVGATATGTIIAGNYIGTDVNGTADLGNTNHGISIFYFGGTGSNSGTVIGGTVAGTGNLISGNNGWGVLLAASGTTGTLVQGNKIGTNAAGTAGIPNLVGIRFDTGAISGNTVGGTNPDASNLIAFNSDDGIRFEPAAGNNNTILGNAIHSNGSIGIDLNNDGVTANDALDGDGGPNELLNFPLLTASYASGGNLTTHFQLDAPAGSYRIEFFRNPLGADGTTFGEGQVFAGTRNVTHPGGGAVLFNHTFPGVAGDAITATATFCEDGAACTIFGSTSEFSKALNVATTAVTLLSFSAAGRDRAVDLSWTTASELSNLGFHLYRGDAAGGPFTRITPSLVPGLGSSPTGRSYAYRDRGLENGRTYYYELEDVETTGRTERHGPVSATPVRASSGTDRAPTGAVYGDPSGVVLREIERDASHVLLELLTPGFVAMPTGDGRVRVSIPGFTSVSEAGEPSLPSRRAFVEAVSGRKVHLASVTASDEIRFPGLRPGAQGVPGIEVDDGTVLVSEEKRREGRAFDGVFPSEPAFLLGTTFQGETKKAEVLLFPLRWDGSGLVLSRRVVVRLDFVGKESGETALGGSRGRRAVASRLGRVGRGLAAQLVARERGLYALAYEDVFGNRPAGMSTASLRVSRQGEDVAFHVEPDATRFAPGSTLYFVSEGSLLNPYGDAVYELETGTAGTLMPVDLLSAAGAPVEEYYATVRREENVYYQAGLLEAPDLWLWDLIVSPAQKSYTFTADHVSAARPGHVSVSFQGASDFSDVVDHHVRVSVNGTDLGETTWNGKEAKSLDLEVAPGVLREGLNTLELECVGATNSLVFLNRFSVRYPRALVATGGTLEGTFAASGQAVVDGLPSSSVLLDTTGTPRWRQGALPTPTGLSFPVEAGRRYLATSVVQRPRVRKIQGSALKKTENQADYLLLAPKAFLPAAQPLLNLRQSEGLVTKAVAVEDVYEQFGHGEVSPEAIKAFLEYAYQSWASPSVRYVVLLGDASYDPKDYLGTGVKDWLPGFPVKTSYLWTVSDPTYASVNGEDALPDIAIGRLPAGNVDEAQKLVEKILSHENRGGRLDGPAVLVADNADAAGNFEQDADEIASGVLEGRKVRKIYYTQQGASTRSMIEQAFDDGASLVSYVGHGATAVWASENIFNHQDVASLRAQSRQPLLLTMNCLNGFFHFPPLNSLSEALVKAEGKGAIAAFSPSGLSLDDAAHLYHEALLRQIVSGRHARLGDAVLAAQEEYAQSGSFPQLLSIYHLFGDPALRIR